jgi:molybdenum cofactor cytidylyltransferase
MTTPKIAGIILAAGEGTRMGETKQLLPFRGQTILECVIDNALASPLHRVVVVLGHRADELQQIVSGKGVDVAINERYRQGQSTSLQAGLRALSEESEAALFILGDQPLVSPAIIGTVVEAYHASRSPIVVPVFDGRRGNPVLFSRETFERIGTLSEDCGARPLLQEYRDRLLMVPVNDPAIHFDIDTTADYQELLKRDGVPLHPP